MIIFEQYLYFNKYCLKCVVSNSFITINTFKFVFLLILRIKFLEMKFFWFWDFEIQRLWNQNVLGRSNRYYLRRERWWDWNWRNIWSCYGMISTVWLAIESAWDDLKDALMFSDEGVQMKRLILSFERLYENKRLKWLKQRDIIYFFTLA